MHADRTNRILLLLLALLLITAGAAAGAASIGAFGTATRHSPLIANPTGHFIGTQGSWLWPAATDRAGDLPITPGGSAGRTTLAARALTEAVAEEVESYRGVSSARARLLGDPADPELVVTAALEETADFAALRQRIETRAVAHARSAIGNPSLPAQLDLTVTTKRSTRVA